MKKRRRRRLSFGTVFMLVLTALVIAACIFFLTLIAGQDVYERTGEFIRTLSEEGIFIQTELPQATQTPARRITFIEEETPLPAVAATPTPVPQKSTITLAVGGTIYAPKAVRQGAQTGRRYDFTAAFEGVESVMQRADLAIATLETTTAGEGLGYDNYNTPPEILDALRESGIDLLALATEHALDKGYEGIDLTVSELTTRGLAYAGLMPESDRGSRATMMRIGGIQVAVISCTYGLSEMGSQKTKNDSRSVLSLMDTNALIQDVKQAKVDGANLVIVLPHWGTKNKNETAATLRMMASQLAKAGADVILGTHPNVVQQTERLRVMRSDGIEYDTVVCYSLGSLMTDSRTAENTAGMIAQLDVTYDPVSRRMTLGTLECIPVYIASQREENKTVYRVVNTLDADALDLLESGERARAEQAVQRVMEAIKTPDKENGNTGKNEEGRISGGHG